MKPEDIENLINEIGKYRGAFFVGYVGSIIKTAVKNGDKNIPLQSLICALEEAVKQEEN